MPRIHGLLAAAILSSPALLATPPADADPAHALSEAGDWKGLEAWSRARIGLHPEEGRPHFLLGVALASQDRLPEAAAALREAVSLAPRMAEDWFDLGLVQARQKDRPGLDETLRTLAEVNPFARVRLLDQEEVQSLLPDRAGIPLVKLPKLKGSGPPPPPPYPASAKSQGIQGDVLLEVWMDEGGRPTRAEALWGPRELRGCAEGYIKTWRFQPATRDGRFLPVRFRFVMDFRLLRGGPYQQLPAALKP